MSELLKIFFSLGLAPSLLGAVKPSATETMTKVKTTKFLMWDEKAIRQNKNRNKGSQISQMERLYLVVSEDLPMIFKKRKFYSGTSHGDCIGPVVAPSWDESWTFIYMELKNQTVNLESLGPT